MLLNVNSSGITSPTWANITGSGTLALETAKTEDNSTWGTLGLPTGFAGTLLIEEGRAVPTGNGNQGLGSATAVIVQAGGQLGAYNGGTITPEPRHLRLGLRRERTGSRSANEQYDLVGQRDACGQRHARHCWDQHPFRRGFRVEHANLNLGTSSLTGTIDLKGANTFSGNTTVAYGTLELSNSTALQNSTLTSGGISFDPR